MKTRRQLLGMGVSALGLRAASKSGPSRGVVCLWLAGGNDSNNMIVPLDARYEKYARARGPLALAASEVNALSGSGSAAGLHPALRALGDLYQAGELSFALNVGDSSVRVSDLYHDYSFLEFLAEGYTAPKWAAASIDRESLELRRPKLALPAGGTVLGRARRLTAEAPVGPAFPDTPIGRALGSALSVIASGLEGAGTPLVIQAVQSGYDTHMDQAQRLSALYAELAEAVEVFWSSVKGLGLSDRVMLYTETEFSRSLTANEHGGTGHGWGGHMFMLGGPYRGGMLHGEFPSLDLGAGDDSTGSGVWRPRIERSEVMARIQNWALGAPSAL